MCVGAHTHASLCLSVSAHDVVLRGAWCFIVLTRAGTGPPYSPLEEQITTSKGSQGVFCLSGVCWWEVVGGDTLHPQDASTQVGAAALAGHLWPLSLPPGPSLSPSLGEGFNPIVCLKETGH